MTLIPGLGCSGDAWRETVERYRRRFTCYVVNLPGFAGQAPLPGPFLIRVRDDLVGYIGDRHLERPILVGHSLGAVVAFEVAAVHPDLVGPAIAVDGVPFLAALLRPGARLWRTVVHGPGRSARCNLLRPRRDALRARDKALASMITRPQDRERVARWSDASDPATVAGATWVRETVSAIRTPVLLVAAGGVGWLLIDDLDAR